MSANARSVALCVGEARALARTAEQMRAALESGDARRLNSLVEVQEIGIWRLGRLMKGEGVDGDETPPDDLREALAAAAAGEDEPLRQSLAREMRNLADVSRQNAVLLKDGLQTVRGLLAILTGQYGEYGGGPKGPTTVFSRRA